MNKEIEIIEKMITEWELEVQASTRANLFTSASIKNRNIQVAKDIIERIKKEQKDIDDAGEEIRFFEPEYSIQPVGIPVSITQVEEEKRKLSQATKEHFRNGFNAALMEITIYVEELLIDTKWWHSPRKLLKKILNETKELKFSTGNEK